MIPNDIFWLFYRFGPSMISQKPQDVCYDKGREFLKTHTIKMKDLKKQQIIIYYII